MTFLLLTTSMLLSCHAYAKATPKQAKKIAEVVVNKSPIKVVTTLAVIASLVKEIGGDRVQANSLTVSGEDPHFVKAKPTFRALVGNADLFMQIGRSLELWVLQVLESAGNDKQPISVSDGMRALEIPSILSREKGDIHPLGNPHVWLSPLGGLKMAENIKTALINKDSANKELYEKNFLAFKERLSQALFGEELIKTAGNVDFMWRLYEGKKLVEYVATKKKPLGGWLLSATSIKDVPLITYHKVWSYFIDEFGLTFFGPIEEKAGVEPSPKYIKDFVARAKAAKVKHVFDARYYIGNSKVIDTVVKQIGGKKLFIDADCLPGETFIMMMDRIMKQLVTFIAPAIPVTPPPPIAEPVPVKPKAPSLPVKK